MHPIKKLTGPLSELESAFAAATRRRLGRDMVSCLVSGSRASGDFLHDSDLDGVTIVRDACRIKDIDYAALKEHYGIRIGTGLMPEKEFLACARGGADHRCCRCLFFFSWRLGNARVLAGRNVIKELPSRKAFLDRRLDADLADDYWWAVLKGSPANVWRREPRRHVGIIIAICTRLLVSKGIFGKKRDLPSRIRRHFPRFHAVRLLRRALERRERWTEIENDPAEIRAIRSDLRKFLALMAAHSIRPGQRAATRRAAIAHIRSHQRG